MGVVEGRVCYWETSAVSWELGVGDLEGRIRRSVVSFELGQTTTVGRLVCGKNRRHGGARCDC